MATFFRSSNLPPQPVWGLALMLWTGCLTAAAESPIEFNRDIRPLLSDRCFACHGPDANHREADLRFDQEESAKESAVVAGDLDASQLWQRITSDDPEQRMPPPDSGKQLEADEIELFRRWLEEGAVWQGHWAFERIRRPPLPETERDNWARNPIDRFVLHRLEQSGLRPSPQASRETLLRRLSFDLIGLPPSIAEIDAFVGDSSCDALEANVDRLLKSPHYGERMAMEWLDGARFADTNGYQNDFGRSMWPWRDWVIHAFNQNMPFDQFTIEQIAGDLLPNATTSQIVATGFNRNHRSVTEGGSIEEEWHVENVVDRVETVSAVFLGLTMGCGRCHDHKYDPISQKEFYQFFAFFNNVDEKGVYIETRGNVPPLIQVATPAQEQRQCELLAAVEAAEAAAKAEPANGNDPQARLTQLQKELAEHRRDIPTVMVLKERSERRPTYRLQRGQYDLPDTSEELLPDVPAFLPPLPADAPPDRLGLARWLVAENNPLVARVVVNRLWQRFFGQGLLKSSENFGAQADAPSHPELLDWLASELMRTGWDLKAMQKLIVTSATYQQSSAVSPELAARDPDNRLLARGPRFRLSAEVIRDNALAMSGLLDITLGGPSVKPYQPAGMWLELAGGASQGPYVPETGPNLYRRSLYTYRKRTVPHATTSTFDAPSWEICQVKRSRTNTPLQALALLNDTTYVEASRKLGERMMKDADGNDDSRLEHGFRLATGRRPSSNEFGILRDALSKYVIVYRNDPAAADALLAHGDSPCDPSLDTTRLAAFTTVANLLFNLDETITKE